MHFGGDALFSNQYTGFHLNDYEIMVSFIDVGQGDSILIHTNNHAVLIDSGEHRHRNTVLSYLNNAGIQRLDYVVATHPHSDHIGGLSTILGSIDVGRLLMPDATNNTVAFEQLLESIESNDVPVIIPEIGYRLQIGLIDMTVIGPAPGHHANLNNASIILRMLHGHNTFLFTGDAEHEAEQFLLNSGTNLQAQVLKVGHHGSRTSTTQEFLDAVNPSVTIITVGADNQFGHPHSEVMQRLQARNIPIFRTDQEGTIRIVTNGTELFRRH